MHRILKLLSLLIETFVDVDTKFDVVDYKAESPNPDADAEGSNFSKTSTKSEDV